MKNNSLALFFLAIGFLVSCESHVYHIYFLTHDATGVVSGSPIKIRGMHVGKVASLGLYSNEYIIITLEIDKKYRVPHNSELSIEPSDFVGNKFISVKLADSNSYLNNEDTVYEIKDKDGVQSFGKNGSIDPDSLIKLIKIEKEKIKENILQ